MVIRTIEPLIDSPGESIETTVEIQFTQLLPRKVSLPGLHKLRFQSIFYGAREHKVPDDLNDLVGVLLIKEVAPESPLSQAMSPIMHRRPP